MAVPGARRAMGKSIMSLPKSDDSSGVPRETLLEQYKRNLERLRAERDRDPASDQRVWLEQMSELASLLGDDTSG